MPNELVAFRRYHAAVRADRYRVTVIKLEKDGNKKTFILDKQEGVTRGWTPAEIAAHTPEMLRLQRRGENIYLTPLSDNQHHLLVDDMTRARLERLIADGYKPAVVLESSPGNYQAILTLPKLGTGRDREVGNKLSLLLNRQYGDPNLSGAIHPHRAPGYENRKPKHQRLDGSYPLVRLLRAEARDCEKALALSRDIDADFQRAAEARRPISPVQEPFTPEKSAAAVNAYYAHYRDIAARQRGELNLSYVDSMIAVRLRATGHSSVAIAGTLEQCAPTIRPPEKQASHNWSLYARRTTDYAFGFSGDQQLERTQRYHDQWQRLEQPAPDRRITPTKGHEGPDI